MTVSMAVQVSICVRVRVNMTVTVTVSMRMSFRIGGSLASRITSCLTESLRKGGLGYRMMHGLGIVLVRIQHLGKYVYIHAI